MSSDQPEAFQKPSMSRTASLGRKSRGCAAFPLVFMFVGTPAYAQSALCPTSFGSQTGIVFQGSTCTNGVTGAYSNAALASESLSQLTQSSTQDTTKATMSAVSERRAAEAQRSMSASRFAPEAPDPALASMPAALMAFAPTNPILTKAPAVEAPHWAFWTQGYGEYEQFNGQSAGLGEFSTLALNVKSTTWSGGALGGSDVTFRNLAYGGDGLILGLLGGYEAARASLNVASISSDPSTPTGFSTMTANLSGPVTGAYASYFNGGFSTDVAFKVEFYDMSLSFADLLGFKSAPGFSPTSVPFSGSGSTRLDVYTASGNVNYRIPIAWNFWVEPTAGFAYSISNFASGADQLGLADGSVLRLQGGDRVGFDGVWNGMRVTTVLTGLLYDDVLVTGGVLANAANPLIVADQGKLRAEGILAFNLYQGNGVSYLVLGDIQGGEGLFAVGGKAGVRVAW